jgi:hypothetical protein
MDDRGDQRQERNLHAAAQQLARELATAIANNESNAQLALRLEQILRATARDERTRCAAIATVRAEMWEASLTRAGAAWPREGQLEARARRTEALAIADRVLGPEEDSSNQLRLLDSSSTHSRP